MAKRKKDQPAPLGRGPTVAIADEPRGPVVANLEGSARTARFAIVLAAFAAFVGTLDNALQANWDDERFLADPDVLSPSLGGLVGFFSEVRFEAYHPLHLLSYWIDVPWVGTEGPLAASVIHGVNLALWIGALWIGFEVFRKLGLTPLAATVGVLAFGIHPLAVEVVCWAACRKDILAIGLSLAATYFHLRAAPDADPIRDRDAWISRAFFVLAALSKSSALTLPLALLAIDLWQGRRSLRAAVLQQVPMLVIALGLGGVVIWVWTQHAMIRNTGTDAANYTPDLVPATLFHLLETSVWPMRLSAMYPLHRHAPTPAYASLAAIAILVLGLGIAYQQRSKPAYARVGIGLSWFLAFALPVLNIVPTYFQWQDRYGVAALIGLAFLLGTAIDALRTDDVRETAIRLGVTAAVFLLPLAHRTVAQVETWSDANHLWGNATRAQPDAYFAWVKLGECRRNRGDIEGSLRALARAVEIAPEMRLGHAGLLYSLALRDEQREDLAPTQALMLANRFVLHPDDPERLREMAAEMVDDGYHDAALYVLGRSLDLDPVSDDRIENAISHHLRAGNLWLARFYLSRLGRRPIQRDVTGFWAAERERLGLMTDEEREAEHADDDGGPIVIPVTP